MTNSRREIHAVNFHIGDWVSSTQALTPMARAAYITVWAIMVKCGGAFDYERCAFAAVTRMTKGQMMKAFEELEARDLISVSGKMIHSPHCQKEIDAAFNRCESAARNGQKGGSSNREAKPMENNDSGEATAKQPLSDGSPGAKQQPSDSQANHDPRSVIHEPQAIDHKPISSLEADFTEWYAACPRKIDRAKALKAYRAVRKEVSAEILLDGILRYAEHCRVNRTEQRFIKHPTSWLSASAWENDYSIKPDEPPPPPPGRLTAFERDCQRLDEWAASFERQHEPDDHGGPIIDG